MTYFPDCFQKTLQIAVCTVLAAALLTPMSGQAASERKQSGKSKKPVATKVVERKKSTTRKTAVAKAPRKQVVATKGKRLSREEARQIQRLEARRLAKTPMTATARRLEARRASRLARSNKGSMQLAAYPRASRSSMVRVASLPSLSTGERLGLRSVNDPLELNSSVALVMDQDTGEVLFSKNDSAVLPIASLTKLMTGLVIADANLPMDEMITITQDDVDTHKGSRSRLAVGTTLSRGEMMHLALMSSENRAANALGRTYPGGLAHFVQLMNAKARDLGMMDTRYVEPTGLMSQNQSSARDLATLVSVAYERPILRDLSTSPSHLLELGNRTLQFNNSNRLIRNPDWDIGLQKTGYISEAGRCLVMQAKVGGRKLIMVFLDSAGKLGRAQDAERVRHWVEAQGASQRLMASRPQG
ncbi:serine hydrolase [Hydrogenophaga sp. ZJX-1]|uniref:serine hydrolase n=1 Tax=Hydrogenophaga sp. ZJX-1 TaxID=3404778 RepID=UPI003B27FEE9